MVLRHRCRGTLVLGCWGGASVVLCPGGRATTAYVYGEGTTTVSCHCAWWLGEAVRTAKSREAVSTADDKAPLHEVSRLAERQVQTQQWCLEYWPGGNTMARLAQTPHGSGRRHGGALHRKPRHDGARACWRHNDCALPLSRRHDNARAFSRRRDGVPGRWRHHGGAL